VGKAVRHPWTGSGVLQVDRRAGAAVAAVRQGRPLISFGNLLGKRTATLSALLTREALGGYRTSSARATVSVVTYNSFTGPSAGLSRSRTVSPMLDGINVSEEDERLVFSSADLACLERAVENLRLEGAEDVTDPVQAGSVWKASCQHPNFTCLVETFGTRITITGPTLELARMKAINFLMTGAVLDGEPEEVDGQWVIRLEAEPQSE
jgi:hypothetical protein